ncbi:hypothetical protein E5353_02720 [Bacteroides caecimuris]|uniref:Uncharacterized protein n=1 Tax=Bacteroides caecimuris TaxID=1796613 RepID=A0A4S2DG12_9BACE|nr:hypothetical protein E5353_02720 [Bacteroides caecimuris]
MYVLFPVPWHKDKLKIKKRITKQRVHHRLRRLTQIGFDIHSINSQTVWVDRVICGELISRKRKMQSA